MYEDENETKKPVKKKPTKAEISEEIRKETAEQIRKEVERETKNEKVTYGIKADWISILVKLCILLLIAFFIIFAIVKIKNIGSKNYINDTIEKMKQTAYVYYKVKSHRPVEDNEKVEMTLEDMINANLIQDLKGKSENCSKEYSYVSLTKKEEQDDLYDLGVYLTCNGEAKNVSYEVDYKEEEPTPNVEKTTLYELKRTTTKKYEYTCPEGYILDGTHCLAPSVVKTVSASPIYKTTPEVNTKAKYKQPGYSYEYIDPIIETTPESYKCSSGYTLEGNKCVKEVAVSYRKKYDYDCPSGTTASGTYCIQEAAASSTNEEAYCTRGRLINGKCYITTDYSVKCLQGTKDSNSNSCYITYTAKKELSDWLFDGKKTYSASFNPKDTDTKKYEFDYEKDNGQLVYRIYIKKYKSVCDSGDEIKGNLCRHYSETYEKRYCSTSTYQLSADGSECYKTTSPKYRNTKTTYVCPDGYSRRGTGQSTKCIKYIKATKKEISTPYCSSSYTLTSDNRCVRTINATKVESKINYSCKEGYTKKGSGSSTKCYKKTTTEGYYYCTNSKAKLVGDRCIISATTTFKNYSCPNGYKLNGTTCYREVSGERIQATKSYGSDQNEETIWSKEKKIAGWTFTGNTKEV